MWTTWERKNKYVNEMWRALCTQIRDQCQLNGNCVSKPYIQTRRQQQQCVRFHEKMCTNTEIFEIPFPTPNDPIHPSHHADIIILLIQWIFMQFHLILISLCRHIAWLTYRTETHTPHIKFMIKNSLIQVPIVPLLTCKISRIINDINSGRFQATRVKINSLRSTKLLSLLKKRRVYASKCRSNMVAYTAMYV